MTQPTANERLHGIDSKSAGWTTTWSSDHDLLFSRGGHLFGTKAALFKLSVSLLCIDVLQQDVSKTPLYLRRHKDRGSEIVKPSEHPLANLLKNGPNEYMGAKEFIRQMTAHLAISSEYFVPVRRDQRGTLIEFAGVPKSQVSVNVNPEERLWVYDINPSSLHEQALYGWAKGRRDHKECSHIRKRSMNGLSVQSTHAITEQSRVIIENMQDYQENIFRNGGITSFAINFPEGMTEEQFERLQNSVDLALKKHKETGKPLVFEGAGGNTPTIEKLTMSAADAEFKGSLTAAGLDMARFFRVPPHKIYLLEPVKYDNMDPSERVYVDDTLRDYFETIIEGLTKVLLTKEERQNYFLWFDIDKAYARNPKERHEITRDRWRNGMLEHNEMREEIGMNPVEGDVGRTRMIAGGFTILDQNNEFVIGATVGKDEDKKSKETKSDSELRVIAGGKAS
ncbi:MAG: phage portal protein [Pseudomonadota bacterium]